VTRAGIHADGINKFWWMYAPFNAPLLVGRNLEVSLTKDSGVAGLLFVIKQHLGIELPKEDPGVQNVRKWLDEQFDSGRMIPVEWPELEPLVRKHLS
jgi:2-phosphinomethylmalic acid synthase